MTGASKRFFWGIAGLALCQAGVWAQSAAIAGDASIVPGLPNNFGGTVTVNVGGANGFQGLLQFDLSTLPPGTTAGSVSAAYLRLFVNKVGTAGAINVNVATAPWSESTVSGLTGVGVGALVAGPVAISVGGSYVAIPVTAQVQAWLTGAPNNGLILTASPSSTSIFFDSKESTATSHPAVLEIDLAGQTGAAGAPGAAGPTGAAGPVGGVGAPGAAGDIGPAGSAGPVGVAGPTGPTGPLGPTGASGPKGATGAIGAGGALGARGPSGPSGPIGSAGAAGATGPVGPVGAQGLTGPQGPAGAAGAAGAAGPQGLILNSFTISPVISPAAFAGGVTQNVILVNNTSGPAITLVLPAATTAGEDLAVVLSDFSATGNTANVQAGAGDSIFGFVTATICASGCTNTSFPVNYFANFVSDGNHHWYCVTNN